MIYILTGAGKKEEKNLRFKQKILCRLFKMLKQNEETRIISLYHSLALVVVVVVFSSSAILEWERCKEFLLVSGNPDVLS